MSRVRNQVRVAVGRGEGRSAARVGERTGASQVAVIAGGRTSRRMAAKAATTTIPIVSAGVGDRVGLAS